MNERESIRKMLRERPDMAKHLREAIQSGRMGNAGDLTPSDEKLLIVAGDDPGGVVGSKQVACQCGQKVWISPSTQELLSKYPNHGFLCVDCAVRGEDRRRTDLKAEE